MMIAVRLLTPAGFMPAFDHGAIAIVVCPDADPAPAPVMAVQHHHDHSKRIHQPCPYASASGLGALAADFPLLIGILIFATALLLGRSFLFIDLGHAHERPPLRGPPIPA
jgi:hypothetical protein